MATESRTPNGFLVFIGSLAALLAGIIVFTYSIAAGPRPQDLDLKRAQQRTATREKLETEARELLTTEGWVDKAKGVVHVPITDAFAVTIAELKTKKPAVSQVKVEPSLPMPPPYDPNAAEPAPLPLPSAPQGADTIHFALPETKPSAALSASTPGLTANSAASRPPLINWNETSPLTK